MTRDAPTDPEDTVMLTQGVWAGVYRVGDPPLISGVGPDAPTVVNEKGAKQSATGRRADLLPPLALLRVAEVLHHGAEKYGANNWRGIAEPDHLNHALIHLLAHLAGDRQDDHLGHLACRVLMALETNLTGGGDA